MVILSRKAAAALTVFFILNILLFSSRLDAYRIKVIHDREDEQYNIEYYGNSPDDTSLSSDEKYHKKITAILESAEDMRRGSISMNNSGFAARNIEKTEKDYRKLVSIKIPEGDYSDYTFLFSYSGISWFVMLGIFVVVLNIFHEENTAIKCLFRSTYRGRSEREVKRCALVFEWSFGISAALWTAGALWLVISGNNDAGASGLLSPIQAVPAVGLTTLKVSILGMICLCVLKDALTAWIAAMSVLFFAELTRRLVMAVFIMGAAVLSEYFIYSVTDIGRGSNQLHYLNFWHVMTGGTAVSEYRNLNILGWPVGQAAAFTCIEIILAVLLAAGCALLAEKRYPMTSKSRKGHTKMRPFFQTSFMGAEWRKVLIGNKGIIFVIAFAAVIIYQTDLTPVMKTKRQKIYSDFMAEYCGPVSVESETEIRRMNEELSEASERLSQASDEYEQGKIDLDAYFAVSDYYNQLEPERQAVKMIESQKKRIEGLKARGIQGWYVDQYSYNSLFKRDYIYSGIMGLITVICICGGIFTVERNSNMAAVIRTTYCGRKPFFRKKVRTAALSGALVGVVQCASEIVENAAAYGFSGLAAPAQSISQLEFLNAHLSIFGFLVFIYILRILFMAAAGISAACLDCIIERNIVPAALIAVVLPEICIYLGITWFRYFSMSEFIMAMPTVAKYGSIMPVLVFAAVLCAASCIAAKKAGAVWIHTEGA